MTEKDWLKLNDPDSMLQHVREEGYSRKLRLFACACCRRIWHLLEAIESRSAVEIAEKYADGIASTKERAAARVSAFQYTVNDATRASLAAYWSTSRNIVESVWNASTAAAEALARAAARTNASAEERVRAWEQARVQERTNQANLLREIFGNPFREISRDSGWLEYNHGTVRKIAREIYDLRRFDELPILADALEDAGCTSQELLLHCRSGIGHVHGCWALDLVLLELRR